MKKLVFCTIAMLLLLSSIVVAAISNSISVQGRLSNPTTDEPFSGSYNLLFNFYDVSTGGSSLGSYTATNVPVNNGTFSTEIDLTGATLDFSKPYWIEVSVNGQVLSPRIKLTSSGYAFSAGRLYATGNSDMSGYNITNVGYLCLGTVCKNVWPTGISNAFARIANSTGTVQFSASGESTLQIAASGGLNVSFDSANNRINYSISAMDWSKLQNYPTSCGTTQAVRVIGDSLTCTDVLTPATLFGGNITGTYNALNLTSNSVDSAKIVDGSIVNADISSAAGIAWSKLSGYPSVTAGNGLTGGGSLSGSVTLNVGAGTGITIGTDTVGLTNPTKSCASGAIQSFDLSSGNAPTCIAVGGGGGWATSGSYVYNDTATGVGIGTSSPENAEGWNRILDVLGTDHAKLSVRTTSGSIDGRIMAHSVGYFGSNPGMIVGTKSNHPLSFVSNGTTRMVVNNDGNVGIGTATPTQKLDVVGSINASRYYDRDTDQTGYFLDAGSVSTLNSITTAGYLSMGGNVLMNGNNITNANSVNASRYYDRENTAYYVDPAGTSNINALTWIDSSCSSGNAIRAINSTGGLTCEPVGVGGGGWATSGSYVYNNTGGVKIGIGNSTPETALHVQDQNARIIVRATDIDGNAGIRFENDAQKWLLQLNGWDNDKFVIWDFLSDTSRLTVQKDGKIGIGTNNPVARLDIEASNAGPWERGVRLLNPSMSAGHSLLYSVGRNDSPLNMGQLYFYYAGDGSTSNRLSLGLHSADNILNIKGDGNVGIGTTTPATALHVNGSVRGNQNGALRIDTGNGYVDIGPENLDWSHFVTDRARYYFNKGVTVDTGQIGSYDEDLALQTSGTTRLTIKLSGNVGIGTSTPTGKLGFASDGSAIAWGAGPYSRIFDNGQLYIETDDNMYFADMSNNIKMYIGTGGAYNGNVGIGTTSPSAKLHIAPGSGSANIMLAGSEITDNYDGILHIRSGGNTVSFDGGDNVGINNNLNVGGTIYGKMNCYAVKIECNGSCNLLGGTVDDRCIEAVGSNYRALSVACDDTTTTTGTDNCPGIATCYVETIGSNNLGYLCSDGSGFDAIVTCCAIS